jgi:hypothetical protein
MEFSRGGGTDGILYKFPTAMVTRMCSTFIAIPMVCGSMLTTAGRTTSTMATIGGRFSQISHFSPAFMVGEFFDFLCLCHSGEGRNPVCRIQSRIPAFAGMTKERIFLIELMRRNFGLILN